ncbi:MAG: FemAB family PEP-CTERM system-associated protein [Gammaproteobacteria bacterium]|nr:FemAB family PEP-CTERM system-associated protein [Gammaproteobacteria bacterium]
MELQVQELTAADFSRWDSFVDGCPEATFFHRAGWKSVLERAFGHDTYYLYAERSGVIEGILPLGHIKSILFGNTLASTPFCVYGGIVALSQEVASALRQAAIDLAEKLKVDALELRNTQASEPDWPVKELYVTFRKAIDEDPDVNLKAIPRKQRAMVRKGIKAGLTSEQCDDWERLYRVYSESVRNLGTPVFAARFLKILQETFADSCKTLMVMNDGRDVAGVLSFYFRDQVLPYYGGSLGEARLLKGNDFMYWELMRRSGEEGVRIFDYGRSKQGTGSYSFKKNWGFTPEPLNYQYYLVRSESIPEVNPMNPKYQLFIKAWKKLPLPVANTVGPLLAKHLG